MIRRNSLLLAKTAENINLKQYLESSWRRQLQSSLEAPYFQKIESFLNAEEKAGHQVFPPRNQIFTALNVCSPEKVKVVIIGQDPYHDVGQAHGLCFSVPKTAKRIPPSLLNIYKELEKDIPGFERPDHGNLLPWAEQGVLMLNATLTVRAHEANSHEKIGWQQFTDDVIDSLVDVKSSKKSPLVFLLWGNFARAKAKRVNRVDHIVIENAHPSPLSAKKWFGCKCFSKCNEALKLLGEKEIDWTLPRR